MGLYNFQPRFVPFILDGRKTHTIRATRVHPDKPGNMLHLYTGLRTKKIKLLMRAECVKVEQIKIMVTFEMEGPDKGKMKPQIWISSDFSAPMQSWLSDGSLHCGDTIRLSLDEREALARRDGFSSFQEMMKFWNGRLPFKGQVIHWRYDHHHQ